MASFQIRNDSCLDQPLWSPHADGATGLLSLPIELLSTIFHHLSYIDLANARLWSRHSHSLLSSGEIPWRCHTLHVAPFQLTISPPQSPVTFAYILNQRRRRAGVDQCVTAIVKYLMKEILPHTASWSDEYTWKASLPDICEGLALSLSVLSDYWSRCLSALRHLPTAHASKLDFSSFESTYPEDYFAQAAAALPFISWLVQQLLHRPSYAGFIERTLRGWHGDALDLTTFEWYLLLTNIFGLTQILQAKTYKERKNVVVNGLRQLDPKASVRWRERWREVEFEVDGEQALGHKEMQSLVALIRTLGNVKAFAVPLGEGAPFGGYGHSREAMQYLRELASRSDLGPPRMTYSE